MVRGAEPGAFKGVFVCRNSSNHRQAGLRNYCGDCRPLTRRDVTGAAAVFLGDTLGMIILMAAILRAGDLI